MDFMTIINKRYATKKFEDKKISEDKINELLNMIKLSASSFGLQPFKVVIVTSQELKDKLVHASWNQPQINTCSHLLVFCADNDIKSRITLLQDALIEGGAKIEDIQGYIDMMKNHESHMDEHARIIWAQKQAYIALGNALNGAKALGFDSCPMEGFDHKQYSEILKLPKNLVPTVLCPVGYAADVPRPKVRLEDKDLFIKD